MPFLLRFLSTALQFPLFGRFFLFLAAAIQSLYKNYPFVPAISSRLVCHSTGNTTNQALIPNRVIALSSIVP